MLIFTNREVGAGTTPAAFGRAFKPGSSQLGVASVTSAGSGWKVSNQDADVSDEKALALLEPLFGGKKPVLLYVHGNNNTPTSCFTRVYKLQAVYPDAVVIGFSWPSEGFLSNGQPLPELSAAALVAASTDDENNLAGVTNDNRTKDTIKGRLFRFRQAQNNAKHSNESLARLLRLIAVVRLRTNGKPYSLAIHSLGTQLFQYALQADGATEAASAAHNVALLAPCVHTTGHKEWISRFRPKGRTYIMYNKGDTVLLGAIIANSGQAMLGIDPGTDRVKSSGVRYVSFSEARNNPGGHGYFVEPKNKALELFTRVFTSRIDFDVHESPKVVYPIGCDVDGTTCYMAVPKDSIPQA